MIPDPQVQFLLDPLMASFAITLPRSVVKATDCAVHRLAQLNDGLLNVLPQPVEDALFQAIRR